MHIDVVCTEAYSLLNRGDRGKHTGKKEQFHIHHKEQPNRSKLFPYNAIAEWGIFNFRAIELMALHYVIEGPSIGIQIVVLCKRAIILD